MSAVLLLIGLGLALAVVEGGLRLYAERRAATFVGAAVPTEDTQPDPLLVAWFKPNAQSDGMSHDAYGFRLNGTPRATIPPGQVAMLGGSTAYGWDSHDDETIEADLEQRLGGTTVINAGYPGLTTLDSLLVYHSKVAPLQPSVVVVLAGLNDLYYGTDWAPDQRLDWANHVYELGLRARHDPDLRPVADAVDSIALRNCFTCYAIGTGFSQLYERAHFMPALGLAALFGFQPVGQPNPRAMQLTAWSIGDLARRVHANGGCLVVAWQPIAGVPDGARTADEQKAVDQVEVRAPPWGAVAPRMFAELRADTAPVFAQGLAREVDLTGIFDGTEQTVFIDDGVHYSTLGNQLIADALVPAMHCP
ncbi:MAG: SGNH/GDSL hydrolase family protein [Chloroflexi bacterium]|nr:SGNH/GDSL hydrolase family protein [Chloroflexota bacterium]